MKCFFTFCITTLLVSASFVARAEEAALLPTETRASEIHWYTSMKEAQEKAQAEKLPLYVCFTGTSWCFWCQRLEKEIHSSPDFIRKVYDKFVFVKLDIPRDPTNVDSEIREMMMKYEVFGVPVILILSANMEKLGQLSYQTIEPSDFADIALTLGKKH